MPEQHKFRFSSYELASNRPIVETIWVLANSAEEAEEALKKMGVNVTECIYLGVERDDY